MIPSRVFEINKVWWVILLMAYLSANAKHNKSIHYVASKYAHDNDKSKTLWQVEQEHHWVLGAATSAINGGLEKLQCNSFWVGARFEETESLPWVWNVAGKLADDHT